MTLEEQTALAENEYPIEEWRDIVGYEEYYQISNFGRVKSLDRQYTNITSGLCQLKGMEIKQMMDSRMYLRVTLARNGVRKTKVVHRLVAVAFIPNPQCKPQVNHIDFNPSNNHVSNLEWCTELENTTHFHKNNPGAFTNTDWHARGAKVRTAKLTEDKVRQIRASTLSNSKLAKIFGVSYNCIMAVKDRTNWNWVI